MKEESVNMEDVAVISQQEQEDMNIRVKAKARINMGLRVDQVPVKIFGMVGTPANPYLSLLHDLRHGRITNEEFDLAIDSKVLADPTILKGFEVHPEPSMPFALAEARAEVHKQAEKQNPMKRQAIFDAFEYEAKQNGYAVYFEKRDHIRAQNKSNLFALEQMLRRNQSNAVYVGRITAAIATHHGY